MNYEREFRENKVNIAMIILTFLFLMFIGLPLLKHIFA